MMRSKTLDIHWYDVNRW